MNCRLLFPRLPVRLALCLPPAFAAGLLSAPALNAQTALTYLDGENNHDSLSGSDLNPITLTVNGADAAVHSGPITATVGDVDYGTLTKTGTGTLTLTNANTLDADLTVAAGTLAFAADQRLQGTNNLISDGATLKLGNGGAAGLIVAGTGLALTNNGTLVSDLSIPLNDLTAVSISGSGSLVKYGTGDLKLDGGTATYTGATTISAGRLYLAEGTDGGPALSTNWGSTEITIADGAQFYNYYRDLGTRTFYINGNGNGGSVDPNSQSNPRGALRLEGTTLAGSIVLQSDAAIGVGATTTTISSVISGNHALTVNPTGTGTLVLTGANTHTGDTTIANGTLQIGHAQALQNSTLDLSATTTGTLAFGDLTAATLGGLSGTRALALLNTASTPAAVALTVGNNNADTTYSGVISGPGSLTKAGTGNLTLSGTSTFTGGTTISAGSLTLSGDGTLGSGPVLNNSALVMDRAGTWTFGNSLSGSGTVAISQGTVLIQDISNYRGGDFSTTTVASGASLGFLFDRTQQTVSTLNASLGTLTTATFAGGTANVALQVVHPLDADLSIAPAGSQPVPLALTGSLQLAGHELAIDTNHGSLAFSSGLNLSASGATGENGVDGNFLGDPGKNGGSGGSFSLSRTSATLSPAISLDGGGGGTGGRNQFSNGGGPGGAGGSGGHFTFSDSTVVFSETLSASGGNGGSGGTGVMPNSTTGNGGAGGAAGILTINNSTVSFSKSVTAVGGTSGPNDYLNVTSGAGGSVTLADSTVHFLADAPVNLSGGAGSNNRAGGNGGQGGSFSLTASSAQFDSTFSANGGNGGNAYNSDSFSGIGGNGGNGGTFTLSSGTASFAAAVTAAGGSGGNGGGVPPGGGPPNGGKGRAGNGGNGGNFIVEGGTAQFLDGSSLNLAGGTVSTGFAPGNSGSSGSLQLQNGTLELPGLAWLNNPATFQGNFAFTGGTLKGTDPVENLTVPAGSKLGSALGTASSSTRTLDLAGQLTIDASAPNPLVLSGTGGLIKTGTGTLTLEGAHTWTGATTVEAGKLVNNGTLASPVTIESGAVLSGSGSFDGAGDGTAVVTLQAGAHLAPGNSPGTLTFADGLTFETGSVLDFELGTASDLIEVTGGTLTGPASGLINLNLADSGGFTAGTWDLITWSGSGTMLNSFEPADFTLGAAIPGYTWSLGIDNQTLRLTAAPVPEPSSSVSALLAGLAAFSTRRRNRRLLRTVGNSRKPNVWGR